MKNKKTNITYDPQADVLSVENNTHAVIQYAQEMGNLIVHFNKKEEPVLVEILQASSLFQRQPKSVRKSIQQAFIPAL